MQRPLSVHFKPGCTPLTLLNSSHPLVITLLGPTASGKTALALAVGPSRVITRGWELFKRVRGVQPGLKWTLRGLCKLL